MYFKYGSRDYMKDRITWPIASIGPTVNLKMAERSMLETVRHALSMFCDKWPKKVAVENVHVLYFSIKPSLIADRS